MKLHERGLAMSKILIVEDEESIADIEKDYLELNGYEVEVCNDGTSGLAAALHEDIDMCILDIMLPGTDGFEICKQVREVKDIPIIMVSAKKEDIDKIRGLGVGADDYMTKPFDFRELTARVKVLLKRNKEIVADAPEQIEYADLTINLNLREVKRQGKAIKLSPKEYNLLLYMVENAEKVISRVEIAEKVWNTHFDTGTNFIDVYINYLRKKIDKTFDVKLIHTKPGVGFILSDKL